MNDSEKTKQQLINELSALRRQVAEWKAAKLASRRSHGSDDLEQLRAIYYLGDLISQAQTVEAIYENALNAVRITLRAEAVAVALFSAEGIPYFNVWRGLSETFRAQGARHLPWSPTEHRPSPLFIPDIKRAPLTPQLRDMILDEGLRAMSIVPLTFQTKLIGHFILGYRHRHQFSEAELWLVQTIAGHVTFAAERKRIENMLRESQQQLETSLAGEREQRLVAETLSDVIVALTAHTSREAVLNEILRQVQRMIVADETSILLFEAETYRALRWRKNEWGSSDGLAETSTHPLSEFPYDKNLIHSRQSVIIPDPQAHLASDTPVFGAIQASLVIPICLGERVLGLLELESYTPHQFSTDDADRLQPLANAAAVALENARLYEQVQRELTHRMVAEKKAFELNRKFLTIQYAGATLASSLNLQFVLETFTNEMTNLLAMQGCIISEWDETANTIKVISKFGPDNWWPQRTLHQHRTLDDFPLMKWVLTERRSESLTVDQPDLNPSDRAYLQANNINSLLILPMEFQDRIVGVIELVDKRVERVFSAEEIALAQLLANQAAGAMENARLYEKAQVEIAERRNAERLFRQVATRKQSILDAIPDSLFFINSDGIILEYKIYRPDEILIELFKNAAIGQSLDKTSLPADLLALLTEHIKKTLKSRKIQIFEYRYNVSFTAYDFEIRSIANGANEVLTIIRNITERKQAERRAIRTERLAALGQLAAALAHEINNPLQAMQSNLDLLLKYPVTPDEREQYSQIIQRQIERVMTITQDVLNFARPQSAPPRAVTVVEQVEQVLRLTGKQLEQSEITVTLETEPNLSQVLAVPDHLNQVFLNLIINAIEAAASEPAQLHIAIYQDQQEVAVAFTSSGPAIPAEILPHIFEPFFTTKSNGNGLGLWISHTLLEKNRGSLTAENLTKDRGVIFTVKLPALTVT